MDLLKSNQKTSLRRPKELHIQLHLSQRKYRKTSTLPKKKEQRFTRRTIEIIKKIKNGKRTSNKDEKRTSKNTIIYSKKERKKEYHQYQEFSQYNKI